MPCQSLRRPEKVSSSTQGGLLFPTPKLIFQPSAIRNKHINRANKIIMKRNTRQRNTKKILHRTSGWSSFSVEAVAEAAAAAICNNKTEVRNKTKYYTTHYHNENKQLLKRNERKGNETKQLILAYQWWAVIF